MGRGGESGGQQGRSGDKVGFHVRLLQQIQSLSHQPNANLQTPLRREEVHTVAGMGDTVAEERRWWGRLIAPADIDSSGSLCPLIRRSPFLSFSPCGRRGFHTAATRCGMAFAGMSGSWISAPPAPPGPRPAGRSARGRASSRHNRGRPSRRRRSRPDRRRARRRCRA